MKTMLSLFALAFFLVILAGCDGDRSTGVSPMTPGVIQGTVALESNIQASLAGTKVLVYRSGEDFNTQIPTLTTFTGDDGYFTFEQVCCGRYLVIGWKDANADGVVSAGDLYSNGQSYSSCSCTVESGGTSSVCVVMGIVQ
jgi:hypothetical protein